VLDVAFFEAVWEREGAHKKEEQGTGVVIAGRDVHSRSTEGRKERGMLGRSIAHSHLHLTVNQRLSSSANGKLLEMPLKAHGTAEKEPLTRSSRQNQPL
jgi:hypothetical protein